ncbi:thermostable 8-oxoguanine DNA glycosylase [Phenylobacterium haematophilum]|uniref:Thermostable 8-oxoguanine DNA glycosylase n=1 Tax=Phenylobacterium haematophilum TaxID=98513 RepID=A0A839ZZ88_9CAUL|nr:endonuclease III domain-containing protein [Phenylobacterium haematophilum]MBB3890462.1 thermostable 8-oxoguanine DNA glycosylase [Phenylobacterium haematophilum]
MQQIIGGSRGSYRFLELPDPDASFLPGVLWGSFEHALTPAFWVSQAWQQDEGGEIDFTLTQSLREEVVTCLLGGHGAPAEVGLAASARVLEALAQESTGHLSQECLEAMLLEPLTVRGRQVRYRFARQRAKFLAGSLTGLDEIDESDLDDVAFRDALCGLPGIGPKTASWIVRNRRASDAVAILDVHIVRACEHMEVFPRGSDPARHYFELERRFLDFCSAGGVRASVVDAVMWQTMRSLGRKLLSALVDTPDCNGEALPLLRWGERQCQDPAEAAATTTSVAAVRAVAAG